MFFDKVHHGKVNFFYMQGTRLRKFTMSPASIQRMRHESVNCMSIFAVLWLLLQYSCLQSEIRIFIDERKFIFTPMVDINCFFLKCELM